jgi:hypothetical protein
MPSSAPGGGDLLEIDLFPFVFEKLHFVVEVSHEARCVFVRGNVAVKPVDGGVDVLKFSEDRFDGELGDIAKAVQERKVEHVGHRHAEFGLVFFQRDAVVSPGDVFGNEAPPR